MGAGSDEPEIRTVVPLMRAALGVGAFLVFLAGLQLFVLTDRTDHWFAWTIAVPLTAAFLGAFYWTAIPLAALSSTRRAWADARVGVPGVFVFLVLTLVTTLLHLDLFHLHDTDQVARGAAWLWLAIYALDPALVVVAWVRQTRQPGLDPARTAPAPRWYLVMLWVQAVIFVAVGVTMFIAPETSAHLWPWPLTPLTARALSSWLVGLSLVLAAAAREADWERLFPATTAYTVLGVLQFVAIARYADTISWDRPASWIYVGVLASVLVAGLVGLVSWRGARAAAARPVGRPTPGSS